MKFNRSIAWTSLGVALAGLVGVAHAAPTVSLTSFVETPTTLQAQWSVTGGAGAFAASLNGTYWDIFDVSGSLGNVVTLPLGGSISLDLFDVEAQHVVAPHGGENPVGPVFSPATLAQIPSSGNTSFASAMAPHDGFAWVTPADWVTPHFDHFKFSATSNTDGSATLLLQAIHPVPEPDAYAMMLAGIGLLGLITRRRRGS